MSASITFYQPANIPVSDTGVSGGAISANLLTAVLNELVPAAQYDVIGGAATGPWYYSFFIKNTGDTFSGAGTDAGARIWLGNSLDTISSSGRIFLQSTSASDTCTVYLHGLVSSGVSPELVTLQGTTAVHGSLSFTDLRKVQMSSTAVGTITVKVEGTILGIILPGLSFATHEYAIGLPSALNTSLQSASRLTAYTGITYTAPRTMSGGLIVPAPIASGDAIQVCLKWLGRAGTTGTPSSDINIQLRGVS